MLILILKMKVSLSNFRSFKGLTELNFKDGQLTLLKGQSGAGKSTILEAIRWCLFGSIRGIYPSGWTPTYGGEPIGKNKTYVIIDLGNLTVLRSQAPEQLSVSGPALKDNTLVSESAQQYIESIFGNKNVWLASSFIRQGEKCPLMTASNTERMTLLNEILFGNENTSEFENPDYYIEKIDVELEKLEKQITADTAVFNSYYTKYVEAINNFTNPYKWSNMSQEFIDGLDTRISEFKEAIGNLSNKLLEVSRLEERKKLIESKLSNLATSSPNIFNVSDDVAKEECEAKTSKIVKLQNEVLALKNQLQEAINTKTKFESLNNEYTSLKMQLKDLQPSVFSTSELKDKITETKKELFKVQSEEALKAKLSRELENLQIALSHSEKALEEFPEDKRDVEQLKTILNNTQVYQELQEVHSSITKLSEIIKTGTLVSESEITGKRSQLISDLNKAKFSHNICNKYNLLTMESINKYIEETQGKLQYYENCKEQAVKQNQYNTLQKQKTDLESRYISLNISLAYTDVSVIDEQILNIENRLGSPLKCPGCNCTLEYKNNTLVKPESELISREEGLKQISELKQQRNAILFNKDLDSKITTIESQMSLLTFDSKMADEVIPNLDAMNLSLRECRLVDIIASPVEIQSQLDHLDRLEEYYKLSNLYKTKLSQFDSSIDFKGDIVYLKKAIESMPVILDKITSIKRSISAIVIPNIAKSSETLVSEISALQSDYDTACKTEAMNKIHSQLMTIDLIDEDFFTNKINVNEKEIQDLQNEVSIMRQTLKEVQEYKTLKTQFDEISIPHSSEEIKQNLEQNQTIYDELLIQRQQAVYMLSLMTNKTELENLQKALMTLAGKQASMNKLKALIIDVTNSALQDLVENINNTTNNILEELFDNAMTIELKLYKEMKAKKQTKPYVNMTIYHNGNTYDNINNLSGGESARVSLALTLSLSSIFPTPFLCLDECMSSLDMNWREACIEVLRKYAGGRTILDIEHLAVEGTFDDVITLGCC